VSFNPFLGMLRLVDYEPLIGSRMVEYAWGSNQAGFGPNPNHQIEGLILMGPYFSWLYSFAIGFLISYVRLGLLSKSLRKPDFLSLLRYMIIAIVFLRIAGDFSYFAYSSLDIIIQGSIVFAVSYVIKRSINRHSYPEGEDLLWQRYS